MKNILPFHIQNAIDTFEKNNFKLRQWQYEAMAQIANMKNVMLCDATCGAGKSTVQALHIAAEMNRLEQEGKHGVFLIASPRLFLNEQLFNGVEQKIENFSQRVKVYNFSSGELVTKTDDGNTEDVIGLNNVKFDGDGRGSLNYILERRHILIVACFCSLNNDLDNINSVAESQLNKLFSACCVSREKAFDVVVIDECHKQFKKNTFENLKINTRYLTLYSATPTKTIECQCDTRISYGFRRALMDKVVVKPWLYTVKSVKNNDSAITSSIKNSVILNSIEHLLKAENIGKRPALCVFDNTVDHLDLYRENIKNKYGDKIDVAVYASDKYLAEKNAQGVTIGHRHICLNFNGEKIADKKTMRSLQEQSVKSLVILSAYMLQEGIDMPYVNGIVVLGEKTDTNLYQAICRGDRPNRSDDSKTHFNVYVPTYLLNGTHEFMTKLCNGFENQLDFGCNDEIAMGQENTIEPADLAAMPEAVLPMRMSYENMVVELIEAYNAEHALEVAYADLENDAKTVLDEGGTRGEALSKISRHVENLTVDNMEKFYEFVHTYTK